MVDEFEKLVIRMNPPRFVSPNPDTHGVFLSAVFDLCPLLTVPGSAVCRSQGHRGQRLRHDCHLGEGKELALRPCPPASPCLGGFSLSLSLSLSQTDL